MNAAELKAKIEKLQKGLSNPNITGPVKTELEKALDNARKQLLELESPAPTPKPVNKPSGTSPNVKPSVWEAFPLAKKFMPLHQQSALRSAGEELESILRDIESMLKKIPGAYAQQNESDATVYAHYFYGQSDWFITEWHQDRNAFFGFVILNGDSQMAELGYISLPDLKNSSRVELDFYWQPKPLSEAKREADPGFFGNTTADPESATDIPDEPKKNPEPEPEAPIEIVPFKFGVKTSVQMKGNRNITVITDTRANISDQAEDLLKALGFDQTYNYKLYSQEIFGDKSLSVTLKERIIKELEKMSDDSQGKKNEVIRGIAAAASVDELYRYYNIIKKLDIKQYIVLPDELETVKTPFFTYIVGDKHISVITEYNPNVVQASRDLNGDWVATDKSWRFDVRDLPRVKEFLKKIYGTDGTEEVTVVDVHVHLDKIPAKAYTTGYGHSVFALGRQLAHRKYRDRKVDLGPNVTIVEGGFPSTGGSVKNPRLDEYSGTILLVRDVPRSIVESDSFNCEGCYDILGEEKVVSAEKTVETPAVPVVVAPEAPVPAKPTVKAPKPLERRITKDSLTKSGKVPQKLLKSEIEAGKMEMTEYKRFDGMQDMDVYTPKSEYKWIPATMNSDWYDIERLASGYVNDHWTNSIYLDDDGIVRLGSTKFRYKEDIGEIVKPEPVLNIEPKIELTKTETQPKKQFLPPKYKLGTKFVFQKVDGRKLVYTIIDVINAYESGPRKDGIPCASYRKMTESGSEFEGLNDYLYGESELDSNYTPEKGFEKQEPKINILLGKKRKITLPNGEQHEGRFAIVDLRDILASHNEETFADTEGYPENAQGNNLNDRNYATDKAAQQLVHDYARNLNPDLLLVYGSTPEGTPIITSDGIVVSGNNRTMSLKLALKRYPEKYEAYRNELRENLELFGFEPNMATGMPKEINKYYAKDFGQEPVIKYPVLVRIDYDFGELTTTNMAKYNASAMKAKSPVDKAAELATTLREQIMCETNIPNILGEFDTLSEFYADRGAVRRMITAMQQCSVLNDQDLPAYVDNGLFTEDGKTLLETVLGALILETDTLRIANRDGVRSFRAAVVNALPVLIANKNLPEGVSLVPHINNAVRYQGALVASGLTWENYVNQGNIFETEKADCNTVYINRLMAEGQRIFRDAIRKYNASQANAGANALFSTEVVTPEEAFNGYIVSRLGVDTIKRIEKYCDQKPKSAEPAKPAAPAPAPAKAAAPAKPSREILETRLEIISKMLKKTPDNEVLQTRLEIVTKMLSKLARL